MKAWLTIPETCAALSIIRSTFYRLVKRGLLQPHTSLAPRGVFISREQVEAIKAQSVSREIILLTFSINKSYNLHNR